MAENKGKQLCTSETVEPFFMETALEAKLLSALESADFDTALQLIPTDTPSLVRLRPNGLTPLHYACQHGRLDVMRSLVIKYPYDVKLLGEDTCSPLHIAAKHGQLESAQYLIENKLFSKSAMNVCGTNTPLHITAEQGHINMVALLIEENICNASVVNSDGDTPLHVAAACGQLSLIHYFIAQGHCNPAIKNSQNGKTALHLASEKGHLDIVRCLIEEQNCDPSCRDEEGKAPLHLAAEKDQIHVVKFLVTEKNCDPMCATGVSKNGIAAGRTALHIASSKGYLSIVQYLVTEQHCTPFCTDDKGITPLHLAVQEGHLDVVAFLTKNNSSNNLSIGDSDGNTPLHVAAKHNQIDQTPLHFAAEYGHCDIVMYLVDEQHCNPSCTDEEGKTPLYLAAENGKLQVVEYLTAKKKCNPMCATTKYIQTKSVIMAPGRTPLHAASYEGHFSVVQHLIDQCGCNPSCSDADGFTPLHLASGKGHLNIVKFLIEENQCNPECKSTGRITEPSIAPCRTPLHQASFSGHFDVVHYLVEEQKCNPSITDEDGYTPLHFASQEGHLNTVQYMIGKQCNLLAYLTTNNPAGWTPLHSAASKGQVKVVKVLIEEKSSITCLADEYGQTALHYAASNGHTETVRFLIEEKRCDPSYRQSDNEYKFYPLHFAASNGHTDIVKYLIEEQQCDSMCLTKTGCTPLHLASSNGHMKVIKYLTEKLNCDPMCRQRDDQFQWYPLHYATANGHTEIVQFLIEENHCDPMCRSKSGHTPLHLASRSGHIEIVIFFTEQVKCDPMHHQNDDKSQWYPLHFAASNGHTEIVKYLIEKQQCDSMCLTKTGRTPLHIASGNGHMEVVKYLTENIQCNPMCLDYKDIAPLHLAAGGGHTEIVRFLIEEKQCNSVCRARSGLTPLHSASKNGHFEVVKFFIKVCHCDPFWCQNKNGITPLHTAAHHGKFDVVALFTTLDNFDPSDLCIDNYGDTAIDIALKQGHLEIFRLLVEKNCHLQLDPEEGTLNHPLHYAAANGYTETAKFLVKEKHCDPSSKNAVGYTPLHLACQNGNSELVEFLVHNCKGDPLLHRDEDGHNPLHHAVMYGQLKIVVLLATISGCDFTCRDDNGRTALHLAVLGQESQLDMVKCLVKLCHCDPFWCQDENGMTPFHYAVYHGKFDVVALFTTLDNFDPSDLCTDNDGNTAIDYALTQGHLEIIRLLEEKKCHLQLNPEEGTLNHPLHHAARNSQIKIARFEVSHDGHLKVAQFLSENGQCDILCVDDNWRYPLHYAASKGHTEIVRFLIEEKQFDPMCRAKIGKTLPLLDSGKGYLKVVKHLIEDDDDWYVLHFAAFNGHTEIVRFLIEEKQCNPVCKTKRGFIPLHMASGEGHIDIVKYLTEDRFDPMYYRGDNENQWHPLHFAAINGRNKIVRFLVEEKQCDPMCITKDGKTPLHLCSLSGHLDVVKYLTEDAKCDPMCLDEDNRCPLHFAAYNGHTKIVKYFVKEKQCDPFCRNVVGSTPLHLACQNGNSELVEFLVHNCKGNPLLHRDKHGRNPLHHAVLSGQLEIVVLLASIDGFDITCCDDNGRTALHLATLPQESQLEMVEYLVKVCHCDPFSCQDENSRTPFHYAVYHGKLDVVALFITLDNFDPSVLCIDNDDSTALDYALKRGHLEIIRLLDEKQCCLELTPQEGTLNHPLHFAAMEGHHNIVMFLVEEKQCDPMCKNEKEETPLHLASQCGHLEVVKYLTEDGKCDTMCLDEDNWCPLHFAAFNGHTEIVKYFVDKKHCDPFCRDMVGYTPLHLACQNGSSELVQFLVHNCKSDPLLHRDKHGRNPLHHAVLSGQLKIVVLLASIDGFDITCCDDNGRTALHLATLGQESQLEMVECLVKVCHCDPFSCQDENGRTPFHYAVYHGKFDVVALFTTLDSFDPSDLCIDNDGNTAIDYALTQGHLEIVRLLEEKKCHLQLNPEEGTLNHPLHHAARKREIKTARFEVSHDGHLKAAQFLSENGQRDILCVDDNRRYPLHYAASKGHTEIVRFLIEEKQFDPMCTAKIGKTMFLLDSGKGYLKVVNHLIKDDDDWCVLHYAAFNGRTEIARFLIEEKQCNPVCKTKRGFIPLHMASEEGHIDIVKYLTEDRCDPMCYQGDDEYQLHPLHFAAMKGHNEIVMFLVEEKRCDPMCRTKDGKTPLHLCSLSGHLEVVKYLIEYTKCDPMCRDEDNWCPLHFAAFSGHTEIVMYFIEQKQCYPMCRTKNGTTPLHLSSQNGHLQVVKYLTKDKKCDPMIPQCDRHHQWYPVHFAASEGHLQIVRFLIEEKQCDPVCIAKNGWTPIHLASQDGHLEVVKYLAHYGSVPLQYSAYRVNPNVVTEFSSIDTSPTVTPLQLAYMKGHFDIVNFLLSDIDSSLMWQDFTCLHMAAVCGQLNIIEILLNALERSRDTEYQQWAGITTLNLAAFMGQQHVVMRLLTFLENQCIPITAGQNPLHVALMGLAFQSIVSTQEFSDMLKLFLNLLSFADVNDIHSELLTKCYCKGSHIEIVKIFLKRPDVFQIAVVNSENIVSGVTLHAACFLGQIEAVKLIIQTDCIHPDNEGLSPLHYTVLGRIFQHISACNDYDAHIQLEAAKDVAVDDLMNKCFNLLMRHFHSQDYLEVCELLIKECHCDPLGNRDKDGETPLHYAAWFNDAEIFKLLVSASTQDPLSPNDYGSTTLHIASRNGNQAIVKFLVDECRVQPMCQCKDGTTPLHWASETGQLGIIEFIISRVSLNEQSMKDVKGRSPLHYAVASDQLTVVQHLIKCNCDPLCKDKDGNTVLHYAALHGLFQVTKYLVTMVVQSTVITNNSGYTPLHLAALKGHLKVVQLLTNYAAAGSRYPSLVMTPSSEPVLHTASRGGHVAVVMFLVGKCRCDPMNQDVNGNTPLHIAASMGYKEIVVYLAGQKDSNVNCTTTSGSTALHDACLNGHLDIVEFLVNDPNCNPFVANSIGATPLHLAVAHGHVDIVKFLCNRKNYSCFCSTPFMYWTPLHLACNIKSENLAMKMLQVLSNQASSDLSCRYKGVSPLHLAAHNGHINIVKFLIMEAGCDPFQPDDSNRIALHYAVENQMSDVIEYLVSHKPDSVFHSDLRGVTPIMCATSENIVVKLLLKGADPSGIKIELPDKLTFLNPEDYVCLTGRNTVNVVGNARSGKSTLIKALAFDRTGFLKALAKVTIATPIDTCIAGIASSVFDKSKYFGPVVFCEYVGEVENYCGHSLSLDSCSSSKFIICVSLADPLDSIEKQVNYWLHWVSKLCVAMKCYSSVIVVGSHRDKLNAREFKVKYQKLKHLKSCWPHITLIDFAILNCQRCRSTEMLKLKMLLQQMCISEKHNITNIHSMLVAFINYKYGGGIPVRLSTILDHLTENDIPLPQLREDLYRICQDLDCSGHIALLPNKSTPEQSWILCTQHSIFQVANAFLRDAKEDLKYKLTGVVPFSELHAWFGDTYDPNFIRQYLVHVEICQPIKDPHILHKVSPNEEYYFFPSLLESSPSQKLWKPDLNYEQYFGWSIQTKASHFLPTQFLHTLLLRFAAKFGATFTTNTSELYFKVDEYCMMWKNGIRWIHIQSGTEAVAQISEQSTVAIIMMRCIKGYEIEHYKHRAEVLKMATDLTEEFQLMDITKEYILHPQSVSQYQLSQPQPLQHMKRYNIQRIVDAIMLLETDLIVEEKDEQRRIQVALPPEFEKIEVLLHFEPFLGLQNEVTREIFDTSVHKKWKNGTDLAEMLKRSPKTTTDQTDKYRLILQDLMEKGGTVGELFHRLQEYSIFQGRSFLETASTQPFESENKYAHASTHQLEIEGDNGLQLSSDTPHSVHATQFQLSKQPLKPVWKLADDSRLGIADLPDIRSELINIKNWHTLGQALGLHTSTLEKIEADNKGLLDDCMRDMLSAWLLCKDDVKQIGVPSWQILAKALLLPVMSEVSLACQIIATYTLHNLDKLVSLCHKSASSLVQSQAPLPQDLPLTTHDLGVMMNILQPVAAKWQDLGLQLGVPIGDLKNISCTPANAAAGPTACLRDMLTKWLQTTSTPNLTSLSVALRCDAVQEKRLADELKESYQAYKEIDQ